MSAEHPYEPPVPLPDWDGGDLAPSDLTGQVSDLVLDPAAILAGQARIDETAGRCGFTAGATP